MEGGKLTPSQPAPTHVCSSFSPGRSQKDALQRQKAEAEGEECLRNKILDSKKVVRVEDGEAIQRNGKNGNFAS